VADIFYAETGRRQTDLFFGIGLDFEQVEVKLKKP